MIDFLNQNKRKELEDKLAAAEALIQRCAHETITVEIVMGVPLNLHKNWFTTVTDEATGINKSQRARLDLINKSSIVAKHIVGLHPLLKGDIGSGTGKCLRIDESNTHAKKSSAAIFGLDNIRVVIKNLAWSAYEKESPRRERKMREEALADQGINFFDLLCSEVVHFKKLLPGDTTGYTGKNFRKETLYSSPTFLRALAGAYHALALKIVADPDPRIEGGETLEVNLDGVKKFSELLRNLNPYMDFKRETDGTLFVDPLWRKTGLFRKSGLAPQSGFQELKLLADLLIEWGQDGKVFAGTRYDDAVKSYLDDLKSIADKAMSESV